MKYKTESTVIKQKQYIEVNIKNKDILIMQILYNYLTDLALEYENGASIIRNYINLPLYYEIEIENNKHTKDYLELVKKEFNINQEIKDMNVIFINR